MWSEQSSVRSWEHLHPEVLTLALASLAPQQNVSFLPQVCQKQARMCPRQAFPLCPRSAESVTQSQPALEGTGPERTAAHPGKRSHRRSRVGLRTESTLSQETQAVSSTHQVSRAEMDRCKLLVFKKNRLLQLKQMKGETWRPESHVHLMRFLEGWRDWKSGNIHPCAALFSSKKSSLAEIIILIVGNSDYPYLK